MRILIAGGTGLFGRLLVKDWGSKHDITILSRNPTKNSKKFPSTIKIVQWDGQTTKHWGDLVNNIDVILNLTGEYVAAGLRWTKSRKKKILESRTLSGQALTQAIQSAETKPKLLIQSSASGYYGFGTNNESEAFTETSPPGQDFLARVCKDWETSTETIEAMGVRRVILRTSVVLSKQGGALTLMSLPYKLFIGGRLSLGGNQWFSWIHHTDVIRAINYFIETTTTSGIYNVTSPHPVRNKDLNRILGRTLRRPWFFHVPSFIIRLVFGEKADILLESVNAQPERLLNEKFSFTFDTIEPALLDIYRAKK